MSKMSNSKESIHVDATQTSFCVAGVGENTFQEEETRYKILSKRRKRDIHFAWRVWDKIDIQS